MTSRAERRRRKKALQAAGLPEVAPVPKRQPNGQKRRNERVKAVALAARQRRTGQEDKARALDPVHGTDMGSCIDALAGKDERRSLIGVWDRLCAARRNYLLRDIGVTGEPQGAAIAMLSEAVETDPSLRIDPRTPDERDEAAQRAWKSWKRRIDALPTPQHKWALMGALEGFLGEGRLWRDQAPTATGRVAVDALRKIAAGG